MLFNLFYISLFIAFVTEMVIVSPQTYKCINISPQAVKKGASQTVIGLIFGCYAVCNLIGSLILGKYVSIWHYFLSDHAVRSVIGGPVI